MWRPTRRSNTANLKRRSSSSRTEKDDREPPKVEWRILLTESSLRRNREWLKEATSQKPHALPATGALNRDRTLEENWIPWLWSRDEGSIFQEQQREGWGDVEEKQEQEAQGDQTTPCQAAGEAGAPRRRVISSAHVYICSGSNQVWRTILRCLRKK
jgi:hypothetical protein